MLPSLAKRDLGCYGGNGRRRGIGVQGGTGPGGAQTEACLGVSTPVQRPGGTS